MPFPDIYILSNLFAYANKYIITSKEIITMAKISVLGAGSGTFALNMIRDFCLTPNLHGNEICFMDIDQKRLDASHSMCVRLAKEFECDLNITKTTSREEALTGANYLINTILINGY